MSDLVSVCVALGATEVGGPLSAAERELLMAAGGSSKVDGLRDQIRAGLDPLGRWLCERRPGPERRLTGSFYTPPNVVAAMVDWALSHRPPQMVDPGCGSGRFALEAIRRQPTLHVVCIDTDPVACLICRAGLATLGAGRARVLCADYLAVDPGLGPGRAAFVCNPPYIRHHQLAASTKRWAADAGRRLGIRVSGLSGMHVHFLLRTAELARDGDVGCFITGAEWLDVFYGAAVRELMTGRLGLAELAVAEAAAVVFDDAMSTAAVTAFQVGEPRAEVRLSVAETPDDLRLANGAGRLVPSAGLRAASRWSELLREPRSAASGGRRLGDVCSVSRGAATGWNDYFVLRPEQAAALELLPWCRPCLTAAAEVQQADGEVRRRPETKLLFDPPRATDPRAPGHEALRRYLLQGERLGVPERYLCSHRTPWWHLGAKAPPLVATYMARGAPAFALNPDGLVIINVILGLWPIGPLDPRALARLVAHLNGRGEDLMGRGRTYHGGLQKFEPREMAAVPLPSLEELAT